MTHGGRSGRSGRDRLHLFGIRHHGPGGAHSLLRALDALRPDCLLIEGPADAEALLQAEQVDALRPPVAILSYVEREAVLASFMPLATFSPEWQALCWGLQRGVEVRFIDLPAAQRLAELRAEREAEQQDSDAFDDSDPVTEPAAEPAAKPAAEPAADGIDADALRADPLAVLARLDGCADGESWWNGLVEQAAQDPEVFGAVEQAMTALREAAPADEARPGDGSDASAPAAGTAPGDEPLWNRRREAHMRLAIAAALKRVDGPVAVVTGAWHVPALRQRVPLKQDRALLARLPKLKVAHSWVPWTHARLGADSGYAAGVDAPGWYAHLWRGFEGLAGADADTAAPVTLDARQLTIGWLTRVTALLREHGWAVSSAAVIEAARLAEALAALRGLSLPGIAELDDAARSALCGGDGAPLAVIRERLTVGATVGEVGQAAASNPLMADFERQIKRLRLTLEGLPRDLSLDLRSAPGLAKSQLLNRLRLLDVGWGEPADSGHSRGSFRENWTLEWQPQRAVALAEALVWGTTVAAAADARSRRQAADSDGVVELATLVGDCLLAGLHEAAAECIDRLQSAAAHTNETIDLLQAVPPLAELRRYGSARGAPDELLDRLLERLITQVLVGLVYASRGLDDERSRLLRERFETFDHALVLLDQIEAAPDAERPDHLGAWQQALTRLAADPNGSALLQGYALRRLYDQAVLAPEQVEAALSRALSPSVAPRTAADWFEGFIAGNGQVLIHDPALRGLVDDWLLGLADEAMDELLPMLRRSFSSLAAAERRRLLQTLRRQAPGGRHTPSDAAPSSAAADAAFAEALPLLSRILGLEPPQ